MRWIVVGAVCAVLFALPGTASAATTCTPSAAHPYPVVLVHGTFENASMWAAVAPQIRAAGYCVFALNYGNNATGDIPTSAAQLGSFVDQVLAQTGASKVDLVGHSQGGMMPRYYMGFLGGAKYVHQLVGIAPSNHGTEGVILPPPDLVPTPDYTAAGCAACADQQAGSPFMEELKPLGVEMAGALLAALGGKAGEVEGYGKGAIVGAAGELEHGALWHVPGGYAMREILGDAKAIVPSAKKLGGPGTRLDVPVTHINASYVRSHFDAMEVGLADGPKADELLLVLVMTTGARIHARVGGLAAKDVKGLDGLR